MAIKIGTIQIDLRAETSSFQTDMTKASQIALNSSKAIERSFTMMGTAIAAAAGSATGALGFLLGETQATVFEMQRLAQQAGTSMANFSKLAYAAKVAGVPTDQLATIMDRLAHNQYLAAAGSLEQAAAFKALGVNVADANGKFKDTGAFFVEVAKQLDKFGDSNNKTAMETMLLGRSGAQLAPLLNILGNRFDELSAQAQKLGVVFGDETAVSARQLHQSLTMIEQAGLGLSVRLLSQVSPALMDITNKISDLMQNKDALKQIDAFGRDLAEGVHLAGEAFQFAVQHIQQLKTVVEGLIAIRLAGLFGPMILSATKATGVMGKLGLASLNLTGNLLGVRRLGTVLAPLVASARDYAMALGALAAEEGVAGAASIALGDSLAVAKAALSSVAVPIAAITAGVWATTKALEEEKQIADENAHMATTWADMWHGAVDNVREDVSDLGKIMRAIFSGDYAGLADLKFTRLGDAAAKEAMSRQHYGYQSDNAGMPEHQDFTSTGNKKNMPGMDMGKLDELQKKLGDLVEKANAAQRALALVGASPQQQRDSEILEKYNEFLIQEKQQLDLLSPAQREHTELLAHNAIVTQVNTEAATKYATDLYNLHESLTTSTQDHLAMAAAIGKTAQAMQDAMVQARLNAEMQRTFGANWRNNPDALNAAKSAGDSIRQDVTSDSKDADRKSLTAMEEQIDAQTRLNAVTLQGAEAKRQAQIINDQEAIRRDFAGRGDTDTEAMQQQIDLVRQKSNAEKTASDLERASGMSAIARYQQQTQAIHDAVEAASEYGTAIDFREVLAADKQAWIAFEEAQDRALLATGGMLDGLHVALDQLARDTESDAQLMHDALIHAIDSINASLSTTLMAHANSGQQFRQNILSGLSNTSRGIGSSLLNSSMKKGESALLGSMGFGKPDGSSQNPWYVKIVGQANGAPLNLSGTGSIASILAGGKSLSSLPIPGVNTEAWGKSMGVGGVSLLSKLFQGTFADGGSVVPGLAALVGERGPELFVPPSAGSIVPNHAMRNNGLTQNLYIDATGAQDPAATVAALHQYMQQASKQIAAHAALATTERARRRPSIAG